MSVNYNDYKAAVERLRRVASGEDRCKVYESYGIYDAFGLGVGHDKATIYDAEHDREPVTVEWLREVGFEERDGDGELKIGEIMASFKHWGSGYWVLYKQNKFVFDNPTRGDVLTALRLFGKREGA